MVGTAILAWCNFRLCTGLVAIEIANSTGKENTLRARRVRISSKLLGLLTTFRLVEKHMRSCLSFSSTLEPCLQGPFEGEDWSCHTSEIERDEDRQPTTQVAPTTITPTHLQPLCHETK